MSGRQGTQFHPFCAQAATRQRPFAGPNPPKNCPKLPLAKLSLGWQDMRRMSASENLFQPSHHHHHRHKKFHVRPEAKGLGYQRFLGLPSASQRTAPAMTEIEERVAAEVESEEVAQRRLARRGLWICAGLLLCVLIAATADYDRGLAYIIWRLKGVLPPMIKF